MKLVVLASGSNGNSTYIESENNKILIDCGLTFRELSSRFESAGIDLSQINIMLITHEHIDHTQCIQTICRKNPNLKLFISQGSYSHLRPNQLNGICKSQVNFVKAQDVLEFGALKIKVLPLHHDAHETIGFIITEGNKKAVYITDTGYVEEKYYAEMNNADLYIMESNYDVEMLYSSDRPFELKNRIAGDHGHMSNVDSAVLLSRLIGPNTKNIVLAHISHDCNFYDMPQIIMAAHNEVYEECGVDTSSIKFHFGSREGITGEFEL